MADKWLPMGVAPRDGRPILAASNDREEQVVVQWTNCPKIPGSNWVTPINGLHYRTFGQLTHWRDLPMHPSKENKMPRCQTCRFWGDLAFNENHPRHMTMRLCRRHRRRSLDESENSRAEPVYEGAEGLATEPDFGCIDWASKE